MPDLRVVEALGFSLRDAFVDLPYRLYRGDAHWVPPLRAQVQKQLDPRRNPFSSHGLFVPLLALRGTEVVGRIVAIDDRGYNSFHNTHQGFFGLLETEDDPEVMAALLSAAALWCKSRGADVLYGPMNFSTNDDCGLLVEGFAAAPMINLAHTRPCYPGLIEGCGFEKAWDYLAYRLPVDLEPTGSMLHFSEAVRRSHKVLLRNPDRRHYDEEMGRILQVYNHAWSQNHSFSPMTGEEAALVAQTLRPFLYPELIFLAEVNHVLVGFSLAVPDIHKALRHLRGRLLGLGLFGFLRRLHQLDALRLCSIGVLPDYEKAGLTSLFYVETLAAARRLGFRFVELSLVHEDNLVVTRGIEALGGVPYKRWRIYRRRITDGSGDAGDTRGQGGP